MSKAAAEMAERDYFASEERVEMAHLAAWTLGCTEYELLSTEEIQVGHYGRIEEKYHIHLRETFKKSSFINARERIIHAETCLPRFQIPRIFSINKETQCSG